MSLRSAWVALSLLSCRAAPTPVPPSPASEAPVPIGPEITELKPTIQPGQPVEIWLRPGPEVHFTPSKHVFERKATVEAIRTPFGEGGVTSAMVYRAALGDPPPPSHLPLWAKSLELGVANVNGGSISVDDDETAGLNNYVGKTADGRLVMLLELGPE